MAKDHTQFAPTSRSKEAKPGEEGAKAELKLGPEFADADTLTHSEANVVLTHLLKKRRERQNYNETPVLTRTLRYLDSFARLKEQSRVESVERLLAHVPGLAKFERAQLGSLCCETAEEAKTLIPSLSDKIEDETLQVLLDEINRILQIDKLE